MFQTLVVKRTPRFINLKYSTLAKSKWQSVVGLEVHAQIQSESKLFSGAKNAFSSPVNSNVSLFDGSIPGTLPVLNHRCVEAGVLTALALNCQVNAVSMFDRKHYYYADMPAGYQITQQRSPLANKGYIEFEVFTPGIHKNAYRTKTHIKQLQLEQDSGKSLHDDDRSLLDLNRAGAPLMEIVFEPDLHDGEEAAALIKELINILQRISTCSCRMEEGALRVDANVSVNKPGQPFGVRTEIKNIASIRGVAGAIKHEIERQIKLLEAGEKITNETRAWNAESKTTVAMRDKEVEQDYRYMPEPNLPPLHVAVGGIGHGCVNVEELLKSLPELPEHTRHRLRESFGLSSEQAIILVNEPTLLRLFEGQQMCNNYKLIANLLINDLLTLLNKEKMDLDDLIINAKSIGELACLIDDGTINRTTGKQVLNELLIDGDIDVSNVIGEKGWEQLNDDREIQELCEEVLRDNIQMVAKFKMGKTKVFKALLGIISQKTQQRVNMAKVDRILNELLKR